MQRDSLFRIARAPLKSHHSHMRRRCRYAWNAFTRFDVYLGQRQLFSRDRVMLLVTRSRFNTCREAKGQTKRANEIRTVHLCIKSRYENTIDERQAEQTKC